MNQLRLAFVLGISVAVGAAGCSGETVGSSESGSGGSESESGGTGGSTGGTGGTSVDELLDKMSDAVRRVCDCMPPEDRAQCLLDSEPEPLTPCEWEVFATPPGQLYIDCVDGLTDDLQVCLDVASCVDEALLDCFDDFGVSVIVVAVVGDRWEYRGMFDIGLPVDVAGFVSPSHDGLGVGLLLSRSIIEAHGGRIWAESNADCGATIRFALPVKGT